MNYLDVLKNSVDNKSEMMKLYLNIQFKNWIENETSFLNALYNKIPIRFRIYVFLNKIELDTIPKCVCGKYNCINVSYPELGFREYCGSICSRKNKTINRESKDKLLDYDWLFNERITLKKSMKTIAKELNISEFTVKKYIDQHRLNFVDSRRKNNFANQILNSKEKLSELYSDGLTCENIAEKLGSSRATVSRWLNYHDLEIRESNSYPRKNNFISSQEQELCDFIQNDLGISIEQSNRTILNGRELDILIPKYNFAIEYNGIFSHLFRPHESSESKIKNHNYHLDKTIKCLSEGIQLYHIYSDEWENKKDIVKSMIRSKLNQTTKIYARKTLIREIETSDKNQFLDLNHMQGSDKSLIKLGLYYQDELVSVMTFCKSRFNKHHKWELSRFACKLNHTIIGGFSKLLKYFVDKNGTSIISYADRRYSVGNVYLKNGFILIHENKPNYYYVDKRTHTTRENRMKFQKKYINATDNQTEYERARELGYEKIYDCGTLAFSLNF